MKQLITLILILASLCTYAQTRSKNASGNWIDPTKWIAGNVADTPTEGAVLTTNVTSTIQTGESLVIGKLSTYRHNKIYINAGSTLSLGDTTHMPNPEMMLVGDTSEIYINGYVKVFGNVNFQRKIYLKIDGGTLIVNGNLSTTENAVIEVINGGKLIIRKTFGAVNNPHITVDATSKITAKDVNMGADGDALDVQPCTFIVYNSCTAREISFCEKLTRPTSKANAGDDIEQCNNSVFNVIAESVLYGIGHWEAVPSGSVTIYNRNFENATVIVGVGVTATVRWVVLGNCGDDNYDDVILTNYNPIDCAPLPLELDELRSEDNGDQTRLFWGTLSEKNFDRFEVEVAQTDLKFNAIGSVKGHGNSVEQQKYEFLTKKHNGRAYYRLKTIDYDGSFDYSNVIMVDGSNGEKNFIVYPNPTDNSIGFNFITNFNADPDDRIIIRDHMGNIQFVGNLETIPVLNTGIYTVSYYSRTYNKTVKVVVK
jgi:hypothetical protein